MRTAARFQAFQPNGSNLNFEFVEDRVNSWIATTFCKVEGSYKIAKTGEPARVTRKTEELKDSKLLRVNTLQRHREYQIGTNTFVLEDTDGIHIEIDIGAGNPNGILARPYINVQAPAFYKSLLNETGGWHYRQNADKLFPKVFTVDTDDDVELLARLIEDGRRRLPVYVVSQSDGRELVTGLSNRLKFSATGLAHVCSISEDASWSLSERLGNEWSVYGAAIRLYWPNLDKTDSPFRHKLWTSANFRNLDLSQENSDWKLGKIIARPVIDISSLVPRAKPILSFQRAYREHAFEAVKKATEELRDDSKLAEIYASENDELREENESLRTDNENLSAQLEHLLTSSRSSDAIEEPEDEYTNLKEAIEDVRKISGDHLKFPDQLDDQLSSITEVPTLTHKIRSHLVALYDLARTLKGNKGRIGKDIVQWLEEKGCSCSGESQTRANAGLHTFLIEGVSKEFDLHTKVTDGTSPDKCVRIYFKPADDYSCIEIGMIGSKKLL
ncbi:MAG: hypothetical protein JXQ85_09740 [Cognatishimia sp.]|uniref:hypothetical protein n=1 Tax=Cognatishimia sp. TaxID=2211648 RepID=UPI003B8AA17E